MIVRPSLRRLVTSNIAATTIRALSSDRNSKTLQRTIPNLSLYLLRQFGIAMFMYYRNLAEHGAPHVHVRYQEHWAALRLPDGHVLAGTLPPRVERRVRAWIEMHEEALMERWARAAEGQPIERID